MVTFRFYVPVSIAVVKQSKKFDCLTLTDGTARLSRNVVKKVLNCAK